jgi:uncharacterized protein YkwD
LPKRRAGISTRFGGRTAATPGLRFERRYSQRNCLMTDAPRRPQLAHIVRAAALAAATLALAACTNSVGGGGLAPALVARMDAPGANLDRGAALGIVNSYRTTVGSAAVSPDSALDTQAQALANEYAKTGTAPKKPAAVADMRVSAGYPTFAETFSGWRNSTSDAAVLGTRTATKGGIGVAYSSTSSYGVYWVLLLGN